MQSHWVERLDRTGCGCFKKPYSIKPCKEIFKGVHYTGNRPQFDR